MTEKQYLKKLKHFARLYKEMLAVVDELEAAEMPEPLGVDLQLYETRPTPTVNMASSSGWEKYGIANNPELPDSLPEYYKEKLLTKVIDGIAFHNWYEGVSNSGNEERTEQEGS